MKSISTRAFGRDTQAAQQATSAGPVFITDHGQPSHVLLSAQDYAALRGEQRSLAETLGMDEVVELPLVTLAVDTVTWAQ
ncbi:type II toxin-antitoxin system Phd/YefM family antitoxin [Nocardioides speluncae]|uniref:type II toxin-antitoxin system Phd/YefM family antitoxin n=1 Tax=Nocardioides speluncae TaxID=2670337 RepID=UPI0013796D40|nr:type II toxin-antitoxin system Phd/YefM family antitoxin [Nocardioides speluncae]